jgi:hypothetical protein
MKKIVLIMSLLYVSCFAWDFDSVTEKSKSLSSEVVGKFENIKTVNSEMQVICGEVYHRIFVAYSANNPEVLLAEKAMYDLLDCDISPSTGEDINKIKSFLNLKENISKPEKK